MKLSEIAEALGCEMAGDGAVEITGVAGLEEVGPADLTFLSNSKYLPKVKTTHAGVIIVGRDVGCLEIPALVSTNPYLDFARALELFYRPPQPPVGRHSTAVIASSAYIGSGVSIGPHVVI